MPANINKPKNYIQKITGVSGMYERDQFAGQESTWGLLLERLEGYKQSKLGAEEGFTYKFGNIGDKENLQYRLQFQRKRDETPYTMDLVAIQGRMGPVFGETNWGTETQSINAVYTPAIHMTKEGTLEGAKMQTGLDTLMEVIQATGYVKGPTPGGRLALIRQAGIPNKKEGAFPSISHTAGQAEASDVFNSIRLTFGYGIHDRNAAMQSLYRGIEQAKSLHPNLSTAEFPASNLLDPAGFNAKFLASAWGAELTKEKSNYMSFRHQSAIDEQGNPILTGTYGKAKHYGVSGDVYGSREIVGRLGRQWEDIPGTNKNKLVYKLMEGREINTGQEEGYLRSNLPYYANEDMPVRVTRNVAMMPGGITPGAMTLKGQNEIAADEGAIGNVRLRYNNVDLTGLNMGNINTLKIETGIFRQKEGEWVKTRDSYENLRIGAGKSATIAMISWKDKKGEEVLKPVDVRADNRDVYLTADSKMTLNLPPGFYLGEEIGHSGVFDELEERKIQKGTFDYMALDPNSPYYDEEKAKAFFSTMDLSSAIDINTRSSGKIGLGFTSAVKIDEAIKGAGVKATERLPMSFMTSERQHEGLLSTLSRPSLQELKQIKGISTEIASNILGLKSIQSPEDLLAVKGIGPAKLKALQEQYDIGDNFATNFDYGISENVTIGKKQVPVSGYTGDVKSFTSATIAHLGTLPMSQLYDFMEEAFTGDEAMVKKVQSARDSGGPLSISNLTAEYSAAHDLGTHEYSTAQMSEYLRNKLVEMAIASPERTMEKYQFGMSMDEEGNFAKQWFDMGYVHRDQAEYMQAMAMKAVQSKQGRDFYNIPLTANEEYYEHILRENLFRTEETQNPDYMKVSMNTQMAIMNVATPNSPEDTWKEAKIPYVDQEAFRASFGEELAKEVGLSAFQPANQGMHVPEDVQAWKSLYTWYGLEKAGAGPHRTQAPESMNVSKEQFERVIAGIGSETNLTEMSELLKANIPDYDPKKLMYIEESNLHMPTPEMVDAISLERGQGEDKELVNRIGKLYPQTFEAAGNEYVDFTTKDSQTNQFFNEVKRVATNKGDPFKAITSRYATGAMGGRYGSTGAVAAHEVLVSSERMDYMLKELYKQSGMGNENYKDWRKQAEREMREMGGLPGSFIREPSYGRKGLAAAVKFLTPEMIRRDRGILANDYGSTALSSRLASISVNLAERVGGDFDADPALMFPVVKALQEGRALGFSDMENLQRFEEVYQQQSQMTDAWKTMSSISEDPREISAVYGSITDMMVTPGSFINQTMKKGSFRGSYQDAIRQKQELIGSKGQMGSAYNTRETLSTAMAVLGFEQEDSDWITNYFGQPYVKSLEFSEAGSAIATALNSQYFQANKQGAGVNLGMMTASGFQNFKSNTNPDGTVSMTNWSDMVNSMVHTAVQDTQFGNKAKVAMFATSSKDALSMMERVDQGESVKDILYEYTGSKDYQYEKSPLGLSQATILAEKMTNAWGGRPYRMKVDGGKVNTYNTVEAQPLIYGGEEISYSQLAHSEPVQEMLSFIGSTFRGLAPGTDEAHAITRAIENNPESSFLARIRNQYEIDTLNAAYVSPGNRDPLYDVNKVLENPAYAANKAAQTQASTSHVSQVKPSRIGNRPMQSANAGRDRNFYGPGNLGGGGMQPPSSGAGMGLVHDQPGGSGGHYNLGGFGEDILRELNVINTQGVRTYLSGNQKTEAQIHSIISKGVKAAQLYYSGDTLGQYGIEREGSLGRPYSEVAKELANLQLPEVTTEEINEMREAVLTNPFALKTFSRDILQAGLQSEGIEPKEIEKALKKFEESYPSSNAEGREYAMEAMAPYTEIQKDAFESMATKSKDQKYEYALAIGAASKIREIGGPEAGKLLDELAVKGVDKNIKSLSDLSHLLKSNPTAVAYMKEEFGVETNAQVDQFAQMISSGASGSIYLQSSMEGTAGGKTGGSLLDKTLVRTAEEFENIIKTLDNFETKVKDYTDTIEEGTKVSDKDIKQKQYAAKLAQIELSKAVMEPERRVAEDFLQRRAQGKLTEAEKSQEQELQLQATETKLKYGDLLKKERTAAGQLGTMGGGFDASDITKGLRNVLGGWGMMYINRLAQMPQRLWQYGYQESEQWEQQRQAINMQSGMLGDYQASTAAKIRQAQIRAGGTMYAGIQGLGTHIPGGVRDLAGAGMAGISAGLGTAFIMQGFSASASLFGPVAAGIGLAVAGGSAIATGISYRNDPDRVIPDIVNKNLSNVNKTVGWREMWLRQEDVVRTKEITANIEALQSGQKLSDLYGQQYSYTDFSPTDGGLNPMTGMNNWMTAKIFNLFDLPAAGGITTTNEFTKMTDKNFVDTWNALSLLPEHAGLGEHMYSFAVSMGQEYDPTIEQATKAAEMMLAGADVKKMAPELMQSFGIPLGSTEYYSLVDEMLAGGEKFTGSRNQLRFAQGLSSGIRYDTLEGMGFLSKGTELPYSIANIIDADNIDLLQTSAGIARTRELLGLDPLDPRVKEGQLSNFMAPETKRRIAMGLGIDAKHTNIEDAVNKLGFRSFADYEERYDLDGQAGLAAATRQHQFDTRVVESGIIDTTQRQFYRSFDVGGDQFQAGAAQTYLGLQTHIQSTIGRDIGGINIAMQGAYGNLGATYLQQMYSGNEARLTQMAQAGMFSQYDSQALGQIDPNQIFSRMDINAQGNLTGLSPLTTSLNYGNLGPAQFASQVWGEGWDNGSAWRTAGVQGLGATWNGRDVPTRLQGMQGMRAMQWVAQEMQYDFQQQMAGNQMARLALAGEYQPKFWAIEDQQRELQHETSLWGREYQWRSHEMQGRHFMDSQALNRTQTMLQRGWTMEDWAYQDQMRNMQWGWQQEDYAEDIRFMTGRQRKQAQRQMERQTTIHGMEGDQIEKQRDRQQELWGFEDERHDMTIRNFQEQRELLEENFNKQEEFYNRGKELQDEMTRLQREYWEKNHELSLAAAGAQAAFNEEMRQYQEDMAAIGQQLEDDAGKYKTLRTLEDEFLTVLTNGLEGSIEKLKELFKDIGVDSAWEETTVVPTGGGGGGGGGSEVINQIQFIVDGRVLDEQVIRSVVRGLN